MLLLKRLIAYLIDNIILLLYAYLVMEAALYFGMDEKVSGPVQGQLIGLLTLTIPFFLYLYLFEKSKWHATLGKRLMGIRVLGSDGEKANYFLRSFFKLLPWEIAHTGIHWLFAAEDPENLPIYVWVLMILPQLIVLAYIVSMISSRGKETIYDRISGSEIVS
ncbi:MAG: hypothetical protein CMP59_11125 [Flavobacteriales bacterium]|nr:hypothetical protein [Flavobacteriales bacterium]